MYIFICLAIMLSTFVAQNKQIESSLKTGYFAVIGVVGVASFLLSLI